MRKYDIYVFIYLPLSIIHFQIYSRLCMCVCEIYWVIWVIRKNPKFERKLMNLKIIVLSVAIRSQKG